MPVAVTGTAVCILRAIGTGTLRIVAGAAAPAHTNSQTNSNGTPYAYRQVWGDSFLESHD